MEPNTSFTSRLDSEYALSWQEAVATDTSGPSKESWQAPIVALLASDATPELAVADWSAEREQTLAVASKKYLANGGSYLDRLNETQLTAFFIASAPKSFRLLVSVPGPATDGGGPYFFSVKTCLALWQNVAALGLNDEARMEFFFEVSERWETLEEWFAVFKKDGLQPVHGEDFWRLLAFNLAFKSASAVDEDTKLLWDLAQEQEILQIGMFRDLQLSFASEPQFPRMFLVSREALGYGLPPGVSIPEELQLRLYAAWRDMEPQPSVKLIRSRVRVIREKLERLYSLKLISDDPADKLHYNQDVFKNLLIQLTQGETQIYEALTREFDRKIAAGSAWQESVAKLSGEQQDMTGLAQNLGTMNDRMMASTLDTLRTSQNLPSWYSLEPLLIHALNVSSLGLQIFDPHAPYTAADAAANDLAVDIAAREAILKKLPAEKKECIAALRDYLTARIRMLKAVEAPEIIIQTELNAAYQGIVADFEAGALPYVHEAFTAAFLSDLGLNFEDFESGDPIEKAAREGRWNDAWSQLSYGVYDDFWICHADGQDYATVVPPRDDFVGKESMAPPPKPSGPEPGTLTPDKERMAWRMDQLAGLIAHDPDFVAFNDFILESQSVINVMNSLLMGAHDETNNQDLKGYLHGDMNRPDAAVVLLKKLAGELYKKYFAGCTEHTIGFQNAVKKLSVVLKNLDPDKLNLPPEQENMLRGLKQIVAFVTPKDGEKSPFESILKTVSDPGFTTYTFERALYVYGPDIAGAVAGAVLLGMVTGGAGTVAAGASWMVRAIRFIGYSFRASAILGVGSVVGKELSRSVMEVGQNRFGLPDYGLRPLSTMYLSGEISGDEAFVRVFGELGREFFDLLGFDRANPDKGLGKLFDDYQSGRCDLNTFVFRLLGEYGYQVATMSGISMFAKGLAALAAQWIVSESIALSLLGRSIQKFAGVFDSLTDRVVMGTLGAVEKMSVMEFMKLFAGEMAEETIEQISGQLSGSQSFEWFVSILNSSRVVTPDLSETTQHCRIQNEDGVTYILSYNKARQDKLLMKLRSFNEKEQSIEVREDGTVIYRFKGRNGKPVVREFRPSSIPLGIRQAFMHQAMQSIPEDVFEDIGILGWSEDGKPVWAENADINAAMMRLRALGFIVTQEVQGGEKVLHVSWAADENTEISFTLSEPDSLTTGAHDSVPANLIKRFARHSQNQARVVYWSGSQGTFIDDTVDDRGVAQNLANIPGFSQMNPAAIFQPGTALSPSAVSALMRHARMRPGEPQTIRVYDATSDPANPRYADYRYVWSDGGLSIDHIGGTANITGETMADIDEQIEQAMEREAREMMDAVTGSAD